MSSTIEYCVGRYNFVQSVSMDGCQFKYVFSQNKTEHMAHINGNILEHFIWGDTLFRYLSGNVQRLNIMIQLLGGSNLIINQLYHSIYKEIFSSSIGNQFNSECIPFVFRKPNYYNSEAKG